MEQWARVCVEVCGRVHMDAVGRSSFDVVFMYVHICVLHQQCPVLLDESYVYSTTHETHSQTGQEKVREEMRSRGTQISSPVRPGPDTRREFSGRKYSQEGQERR